MRATLQTRCDDASSSVGSRSVAGNPGKFLAAEAVEKGRGSVEKFSNRSAMRHARDHY